MPRLPVLPALFTLALALPLQARATVVRNVPADFPAIQQALDVSTSGDIVRVAPGTYLGALTLDARHSGVHLVSVAGPEVTTIDGGRTGSTISGRFLAAGTSIEGFTITGGGSVPASNTLGGGLYLDQCSLTLSGNIIAGNVAGVAGGMYVNGGAPLLLNNTIRDNSAPNGSGGGIYCDHSAAPVIQGNVIWNNSCAAFGGGVTAWEHSSPSLIQNTIVGNHAAMGGGGLYVIRSSTPVMLHTIVAFNTDVGVVLVDQGSGATLGFGCDDVYGNTPANFSGVADPAGHGGNLSVDPIFCAFAVGDFHLADISLCNPANNPACGGIGAVLEVRCSVLPVKRATWGQLKSSYR